MNHLLLGVIAWSVVVAGAVGYSIGDRFGTPCPSARLNEDIVADILNVDPKEVRPISADIFGGRVRIVYAARYREDKCTMLVGNGRVTSCEGGK